MSISPLTAPDWRDILDQLHAFVGLLSLDGTVLRANQAPLQAPA